MAISMPLKVPVHMLPHLKDLISEVFEKLLVSKGVVFRFAHIAYAYVVKTELFFLFK